MNAMPPTPGGREPPPLPGAPWADRGGADGVDVSAWHYGTTLVAYDRTVLPERCVKCNGTTGVRMKRKTYSWVQPLLMLTIFAGVIVYIILAAILQKKATITYGLCADHRRKRMWGVWIIVGTLAVSVLLVVLAIKLEEPLYLLGTLAGIVGALVYGSAAMPVLKPRKIDGRGTAEFSGCGREFLATLPKSQWGDE